MYFKGLMLDTSFIDLWLVGNNLCALKLIKLFNLVLLSFDGSFIFGKRPFYSFFHKFFEILIYLRKLSKVSYVTVRQFYCIFFKLFCFVRINKSNLRKKYVKSKPIRFGIKLLR